MRLLTPSISRLADDPPARAIGRARQGAVTRRLQQRLLVIGLMLLDLAMIALAFGSAYWTRFELSLPIFKLEVIPTKAFYVELVMVLMPIWLMIFIISGLYRMDNLLGGTHEYALLFRTLTIGFLIMVVAGFLAELIIARGWMLLAWLYCFLFVALGRFGARRVVYWLRTKGLFLSTAIIVGANAEGRSLAEQLLSWSTSGLDLLGFVDDQADSEFSVYHRLPVLGTPRDLETIVEKHHVQEVVLATSALSREEMLDIFKRFGVTRGVNLRMSSGLFEVITTGLNVKEFAYVPLVGVNKVRLQGADQFFKAALDYSLGLVALILGTPILLLISAAILLDSRGSIIHRRRVMGVNGRTFDAFKFRTMVVDGDSLLEGKPALQAELARNHKLKKDPRVTRVGAILRRLSLDELPQILNVMRGEMSLVGPRMISQEEVEKYDQWAMNLMTVKPGMTGLWQVSGRSDLDYDDRVRLDMYYIRNWTIWLDVQILFQTLPAVIRGVGAY